MIINNHLLLNTTFPNNNLEKEEIRKNLHKHGYHAKSSRGVLRMVKYGKIENKYEIIEKEIVFAPRMLEIKNSSYFIKFLAREKLEVFWASTKFFDGIKTLLPTLEQYNFIKILLEILLPP